MTPPKTDEDLEPVDYEEEGSEVPEEFDEEAYEMHKHDGYGRDFVDMDYDPKDDKP